MGFLTSLRHLFCGSAGKPHIDETRPDSVYQVYPPQQETDPQYQPTQFQSQRQQKLEYHQQRHQNPQSQPATYQQPRPVQHDKPPEQGNQEPKHLTSNPPERGSKHSEPKLSHHPGSRSPSPPQKGCQSQPAVIHRPDDDSTANRAIPHDKYLEAQPHAKGDGLKRRHKPQEVYRSAGCGGAQEPSDKGKRHHVEVDKINKEAGIVEADDIDSGKKANQNRGDHQIPPIVGQGLHFQGSVAKFKPDSFPSPLPKRLTPPFAQGPQGSESMSSSPNGWYDG